MSEQEEINTFNNSPIFTADNNIMKSKKLKRYSIQDIVLMIM